MIDHSGVLLQLKAAEDSRMFERQPRLWIAAQLRSWARAVLREFIDMAGVVVNVSWRLTSTSARAQHRTRDILLSGPIFSRHENLHGFVNTMLHEIAHLRVGPRHGHSAVWRQEFIRLGGNGMRTHSYVTARKAKKLFYAECERCGGRLEFGPVRWRRLAGRPGRYTHAACGGTVVAVKTGAQPQGE